MNFSVASPATTAGRRPPGPIIAALTRRERELFLDASLPGRPVSSRIEFASDADLSPDTWIARIDAWRPEVLVSAWSTPPLPASWLAAPNCPLRYVCHVTGSVRQIVPRTFIENGGIVTNWGDRVSSQVAEHALLLVLAALRNQVSWPGYIARPPSTRHITELNTRTLFGLRVGLHGLGGVARAILPLLAPFGVTVTAFSAGVPEEIFGLHGVRRADSLHELFSNSDVLIECESLTPATRGCVTAQLLAALPDDAVFVNVGRGEVVDEASLVREANSGRLRVALDVSVAEPLVPDSEVVRSGRIVNSPHIGGPTFDRYDECGARALDNLQAYLDASPLDSVMSLAAFDRAT